MDFQIALVGLNHRTASVDIREQYALGQFCSPENWGIPCTDPLQEVLILSTCNRVEILGVGSPNCEEALIDRWAKVCGTDAQALKPYIYVYRDLDAARHVFEVAASLDSMVLGEPQILGQLKAAYREAVDSRGADIIINSLMHKAFSTAKRVRHETAIAASAVSISYAAVELAKRIFGQMANHKALLLGAGEMAELAAVHLLQAGMDEIIVMNRTMERGEELAKRFRGRAEPFERLTEVLPEVDVVIASTGSPEPIVTANHIRTTLKARKNHPMFLIDIAVPRDIAADVNALDNVYLYDIDDLKEVIEENRQARQTEATRAREIIEEELAHFGNWLQNLALKPTIVGLIGRGEEIAQKELQKVLHKLGPVSPETRQAMEQLARGIVNKLNHPPLAYLKNDGMGRLAPHDRIATIRRIYKLD